jgi:hypothetical protein
VPFKHNAARRHRIPKVRHRVQNWPAYEAGLRRRGDLTFWLDETALAGWHAPRRTTPGGQPLYSDLAIEMVLTLRLVLHLALRQAAAFTASVLRLLGHALAGPDHTTLSRRGQAFAGRQPRVAASGGPVHLVLDSTGLQLFGQGEWDAERHGRAKRRWLKLHLAVDADTGEIAAHVLTEGTADDAAQVPALLGQAGGVIASVTADGPTTASPHTPLLWPGSATRRPTWSSRRARRRCPAPMTPPSRARATATSGSSRSGAGWRGSGRRDTGAARSARPPSAGTNT